MENEIKDTTTQQLIDLLFTQRNANIMETADFLLEQITSLNQEVMSNYFCSDSLNRSSICLRSVVSRAEA